MKRTPPDLRPTVRARMPYEFVLDELVRLEPRTNRMFGCFAVYVGERIVFCLRERPTAKKDNGVWIATTKEHHASLKKDLPSMRSIGVLGEGVTGWQVLPASSPDFEEDVLKACAMVRKNDPRVGKIPAAKRKKAGAKSTK